MKLTGPDQTESPLEPPLSASALIGDGALKPHADWQPTGQAIGARSRGVAV